GRSRRAYAPRGRCGSPRRGIASRAPAFGARAARSASGASRCFSSWSPALGERRAVASPERGVTAAVLRAGRVHRLMMSDGRRDNLNPAARATAARRSAGTRSARRPSRQRVSWRPANRVERRPRRLDGRGGRSGLVEDEAHGPFGRRTVVAVSWVGTTSGAVTAAIFPPAAGPQQTARPSLLQRLSVCLLHAGRRPPAA